VEAVPATSGVRRTVRLAAALVVGQVLLVAIVGWVTLTRAGDRTAPTARGVDQLAAPPGPMAPAPPAHTPPGPPKSPAPSGSTGPAGNGNDGSAGNGNDGSAGNGNDGPAAGGRAGATDQQAPHARKSRTGPDGPALAPSPPGTSSGPLSLIPPTSIPPTLVPSTAPTLLAGAPPTAPTPPPIPPAATPSPSAGVTAAPVLAGRPCDRLGALARADDGRMVRCLVARDYQLRWKIV
jgi:hypothetical protein